MPSTVVQLEIDTQPDGSLVVRWAIEGDPVDVDVASGPTADHLDHQHETTVEAGQTTVRLVGRPAGRHFVSVAPHGGGPASVAADRRVPFDGISNFRDLGGYRTRAGGRVRWGLVFRADALHGLSARDMTVYDQLGLRTVFDLRSDVEREERPNPVPSRALTIAAPRPDPGASAAAVAAITDGEQFLNDLYVALIEHAATQIGEIYTGLLAGDGLPAVFHCHAGKDRTGIVAALLLEALGVERSIVLDDYELTARYRLRAQQESTFQRLLDYGIPPEAAAGVLTTPRWAMADALDVLDGRYGDVERYLTGPAGMGADDLQALRQRLVDPAA